MERAESRDAVLDNRRGVRRFRIGYIFGGKDVLKYLMRSDILTGDKNFRGKKVLIFGLGLNGGGVESAIWFARHKAKVAVTDIKNKEVLKPSLKKLKGYKFKYSLGGHRQEDIRESDIIIQNPGVPNDSPFIKLARNLSKPIYNAASIFFYYCPLKIIAVTGTRGKSTTSYITWLMLKKKFKAAKIAGLSDSPILRDLDKLKLGNFAVLELSSWQLEFLPSVKKSPQIAAITNIYEDHLNRYVGMEDYIDAKWNIFAHQKAEDTAVLNADNELLMEKLKKSKIAAEVNLISLKKPVLNGAYLDGSKIIKVQRGEKETLLDLNKIKGSYLSRGEHNMYNLLIASFIVRHLGIDLNSIKNVAMRFSGLPGRQELIRTLRGVEYYNDTTSTTPIACIQALNALGDKNRALLIAGGEDKNLNYGALGKAIKKSAKALMLLPGSASAKILEAIKKEKYKGELILAQSLKQALDAASSIAKRGDRVIFSPAGASFNLFLNEFDRGEKFVKLIADL